MFGFIAGYRSRNSSVAFGNNLGITLALLAFLTATVSTSAAQSLSSISCAGNSYNGPATDPCSVYLTTTTYKRLPVTLSSDNPAVTLSSGVATVRRGTAAAGFKAIVNSVTTPQTATITAQANGVSTTFSITLSPPAPAASVGTATLSLNAASIGFGNVVVNTPASQTVTLSSTGTASVTVNSATVSGTGFSVPGTTFPATLNPGQSMTLDVQFDPTAAASYSGQLTIASSVSTSTVALSGTGISHEVDLSWVAPASSSDPVTGYNVYRAPTGTTAFQRVNSAATTQTAYSDSSVQASATYDYIVKSVDAQGVESLPSNTTTITVP